MKTTGVGFDSSRAIKGNKRETIKMYMRLHDWDPDGETLGMTIWAYDWELAEWIPMPASLHYLAGTPLNFICWTQGEIDGLYGFTFQFKGKEKAGALKQATIKTLGSYATSTACTINCSGYDERSGWAGQINIGGSYIPDSKVPQDLLDMVP